MQEKGNSLLPPGVRGRGTSTKIVTIIIHLHNHARTMHIQIVPPLSLGERPPCSPMGVSFRLQDTETNASTDKQSQTVTSAPELCDLHFPHAYACT